jgi:hypothetical protein
MAFSDRGGHAIEANHLRDRAHPLQVATQNQGTMTSKSEKYGIWIIRYLRTSGIILKIAARACRLDSIWLTQLLDHWPSMEIPTLARDKPQFSIAQENLKSRNGRMLTCDLGAGRNLTWSLTKFHHRWLRAQEQAVMMGAKDILTNRPAKTF